MHDGNIDGGGDDVMMMMMMVGIYIYI